MSSRNWLLAGTAVCAIVMAQSADAQQITGALRGRVTGHDGAPLAGVTVQVTSDNTGATVTTTTGSTGTFSVPGLSVSGTYTVKITADGFGTKTLTKVGLSLGETASLNVRLDQLQNETVVVTGTRQSAASAIVESSGVGTTFDTAQIRNTPTVEHDIKDIIQNSPFAFVDPIGGGDNPPVATLSIAGSNPRCQNFLVDGIQVKDNFGLNLQGYPTARSPVPTEWTDQVQVVVTPYDVEYNDTCGGTINLVTKSGSNEFHGGAYFYFKNDALNGQSFTDQHGNEVSPTVPKFDEKNFGAYLSGPVIEDRLFFFAAYDELQRTSAPGANAVGPDDNANFVNQAPGITQAEVDQVTAIAKSVYGFDAGNLGDNFTEYNQRYMGKLTWNIDDRNTLVAAYSHTSGGTLTTGGGNTGSHSPQVVLPSNWYIDAEKLETYSLHYTGRWSDNLTAEIFAAHEGVKGNQTPLGGTNFPEVSVRVPGANGVYEYGTATTAAPTSSDDGYITLGPDIFRHWNYLFYKNDSIKGMLTYTLGDHTLKGGVEMHRIGIINSFTPGAQSVVRFDSISDFQNGIIAQTLDKRSNTRSQLNGTSVYYSSGPDGNPADADARFRFYIESGFVQDEWHPIDHLKVEGGLRYDQYVSNDRPVLNKYFQQRYGFSNQRNVNGLHALLPRLSFTYSDWVPDQNLIPDTAVTFRGGLGKYSGGFQTVWVSNSYANTGVTSVTTFGFPGGGGAGTCTSANAFGCVPTILPTNHQQWLTDLNNGPLSLASVQQTSAVNAILPNFKLPSTMRYNLGFDVFFGDGWLGSDWQWSVDALAMNFYNQPYWANLRITPSGSTAPDGRIIYRWVFDAAHPDPVTGKPLTFGSDIGMGSKSGASGMYFITNVQKDWKNTGFGDFTFNVGYTHSHETEVSPATSSTASSSYFNRAGVNYNEPEIGTSDYQRDHRFVATLNVVERFFGDLETRFNFYGSEMSGQHYSATYNNNSAGSSLFGPAGNTFSGSLIYVPAADGSGNVTATSDPRVAYGGGFDVAAFNTMLHQTGLIKYAGHIEPRGALQGPWDTLINMGVEQELPTVFEGHHLIASLDIFNLANLINPKWGSFVYPPFPQNVQMLQANIVNGQYQYVNFGSAAQIKQNYYRVTRTASTYQIQVGIRYEF